MPGYDDLIESLAADEAATTDFLKACLTKLGLEVSPEASLVPSLSRLHLSSIGHVEIGELLHSFGDIVTKDDQGGEFIRGENDTFHLEKPETQWSMASLGDALDARGEDKTSAKDTIPDQSTIIKRMVSHDEAWPEPKETPYFNHSVFYSSLQEFRGIAPKAEEWGNVFMYGEVVTSTNTLLDK